MFIGIDVSDFCPEDGEACGAGVGEAAGICIPGIFCISVCWGEAAGKGVGEAAGVRIPGMLLMSIFCCDGADVGEVVGTFMPGMFSISLCPAGGEGFAVGDLAGIRMPRMFMPFMFMPRMACLLGARRALRLLRTPRLAFDLAFSFDFPLAFGLDIFMPGMSCMS